MILSKFNHLEYDGTVGVLAQEFASIYETMLEDAPEIIFAVTNNYKSEVLTRFEKVDPKALLLVDLVIKDYKEKNAK